MMGFLERGAKVTLLSDLTKGLNEQTPQVIQRHQAFANLKRLNATRSTQLTLGE